MEDSCGATADGRHTHTVPHIAPGMRAITAARLEALSHSPDPETRTLASRALRGGTYLDDDELPLSTLYEDDDGDTDEGNGSSSGRARAGADDDGDG